MFTSANRQSKSGIYYLIEDPSDRRETRSKAMSAEILRIKKHISNLMGMIDCSDYDTRQRVHKESTTKAYGYKKAGKTQGWVMNSREEHFFHEEGDEHWDLGSYGDHVAMRSVAQPAGQFGSSATCDTNDLILEFCGQTWGMEDTHRLLNEIKDWREATNKVLRAISNLRVRLNRDREMATRTILKVDQMRRGFQQKIELADAAIDLLQNFILDEGTSRKYLHL